MLIDAAISSTSSRRDTGPRDSARRTMAPASADPKSRAHALNASPRVAQLAKMAAALQGRASAAVQRKTPSPATITDHLNAFNRHIDDRRALRQALMDMVRSRDPRSVNTVRWIQTGRSKLFALTPTPDSAARAAHKNKGSELAMFGGQLDVYSPPQWPSYDRGDMDNEEGLMWVPPESGGFRLGSGGGIYITQPARRGELNEQLQQQGQGAFDPIDQAMRHETQHEADVDFNLDTSDARTGADRALAEYRTEFRAYSAQRPDWLGEELTSERKAALTELGMADFDWKGDVAWRSIFLQIVRNYPRVRTEWMANLPVRSGESFREAVLKTPRSLTELSANPDNSPEVAALWRTLKISNIRNTKKTDRLIAKALAVSAADRRRMLAAESRWLRWMDGSDDEWVVAETRVLLSDNPRAFGQLRAKALQAADDERRRIARSKPPLEPFLARFKSWPEVEAFLKEKHLDTNEVIADELGMWRSEFSRDFVDAFLGNTTGSPGVDWWEVLGL